MNASDTRLRVFDPQLVAASEFVQSFSGAVTEISYMAYVEQRDRSAVERELQCALGSDTLAVKEFTSSGINGNSSVRDSYAVFCTSSKWNITGILGLDLLSQPARADLFQRAREANEALASSPLELVITQSDGRTELEAGFLATMPVFATGRGYIRPVRPAAVGFDVSKCPGGVRTAERMPILPPVNRVVDEEEYPLRGWVTAVFRTSKVVTEAAVLLEASDRFGVSAEDVTDLIASGEVDMPVPGVYLFESTGEEIVKEHKEKFGKGAFVFATEDVVAEEPPEEDAVLVSKGSLESLYLVPVTESRAADFRSEAEELEAERSVSVSFSGTIGIGGRIWNVNVVARPSYVEFDDGLSLVIAISISASLGTAALVFLLLYVSRERVLLEANEARHRAEREAAIRGAHETTISYATHELRNPLQVVMGSASLALANAERTVSMLDTLANELEEVQRGGRDGREVLNRVVEELRQTVRANVVELGTDANSVWTSSRVMDRLIEDLVGVQRIRDGVLKVFPEPMSPRRVAKSVLRSATSIDNAPNVRLVIADNTPPLVLADVTRTEQVLRLLVEKAVRYAVAQRGGPGVVSVSVSTELWPFKLLRTEATRVRSHLGVGVTDLDGGLFANPQPSKSALCRSQPPPSSDSPPQNPISAAVDWATERESVDLRRHLMFRLGLLPTGEEAASNLERAASRPVASPAFGIMDVLYASFPRPVLSALVRSSFRIPMAETAITDHDAAYCWGLAQRKLVRRHHPNAEGVAVLEATTSAATESPGDALVTALRTADTSARASATSSNSSTPARGTGTAAEVPVVVFRVVDSGQTLGGYSHRSIFRKIGIYAGASGADGDTTDSSIGRSWVNLPAVAPVPTDPATRRERGATWSSVGFGAAEEEPIVSGSDWTPAVPLSDDVVHPPDQYVGRVQGSALGLSTAARLAHALGGLVTVFEARISGSSQIVNVAEFVLPINPPWRVLASTDSNSLRSVGGAVWKAIEDLATTGGMSGDFHESEDSPRSIRDSSISHGAGRGGALTFARTPTSSIPSPTSISQQDPTQLQPSLRPAEHVAVSIPPPHPSTTTATPTNINLHAVSSPPHVIVPDPSSVTNSSSTRNAPIATTPHSAEQVHVSLASPALPRPPRSLRQSSSLSRDSPQRPRRSRRSQSGSVRGDATPSAGHAFLNLRVLVVDDDPTVRAIIVRFLERYGCTFVTLPDGDMVENLLDREHLLNRPHPDRDPLNTDLGHLAEEDKDIEEDNVLPKPPSAIPPPPPSSSSKPQSSSGSLPHSNLTQTSSTSSERAFDIIIMDIVMARSDGGEVVRHLINERGLRIPVIALSANTQSWDNARFRACGFHAFATKPVDFNQLHAIIETVALNKPPHPSIIDRVWRSNSTA